MTDEECKGEDSSKSFLCVENISGDGLLTNLFDMESGEFFLGFLPFQCLISVSFNDFGGKTKVKLGPLY